MSSPLHLPWQGQTTNFTGLITPMGWTFPTSALEAQITLADANDSF